MEDAAGRPGAAGGEISVRLGKKYFPAKMVLKGGLVCCRAEELSGFISEMVL